MEGWCKSSAIFGDGKKKSEYAVPCRRRGRGWEQRAGTPKLSEMTASSSFISSVFSSSNSAWIQQSTWWNCHVALLAMMVVGFTITLQS